MRFKEKLLKSSTVNQSWLCVGLDPDIERLPESVENSPPGIAGFLRSIIDSTRDLVCAYKPNAAFYEQFGDEGVILLKETIDYIPDQIPVILDAKRGDIGNTSRMYAAAAFDYYGADAVTVHPYMGIDSVRPFLDYKEKGVFVLCLTSNQSSGDFQKRRVDGDKLFYELVAETALTWNENDNVGLVVGATRPEELSRVRKLVGEDIPILIPGVGVQGGDLELSLENGSNSAGKFAIINSSRSILYASPAADYADRARAEAMMLVTAMRKHRESN